MKTLLTIFFYAALSFTAIWLPAQFITFNASGSAPYWGFARLPMGIANFFDMAIERGDWVGFVPPVEHRVSFAKQVVGIAGDIVHVRDQMVFVETCDEPGNGWNRVGEAKVETIRGRKLAVITEGEIPKGYYFVTAPSVDSYDSRYAEIGLVHETQIIEHLFPFGGQQ